MGEPSYSSHGLMLQTPRTRTTMHQPSSPQPMLSSQQTHTHTHTHTHAQTHAHARNQTHSEHISYQNNAHNYIHLQQNPPTSAIQTNTKTYSPSHPISMKLASIG